MLMMLFIYTLTFDIFLNQYFRIPSPIITCIPLIVLFRYKAVGFWYTREIIVLTVSVLLYYLVGTNNLKAFSINIFVLVTTALYFNYFVGLSTSRLNKSIFFFAVFLLFSVIVLLLNQFYGSSIIRVRSILIGAPIQQSPSGIASSIFTFGYQLAAIVTFIFIYTCTSSKNIFIIISVLFICLLSIYLGLQRSVLVAFLLSVFLFFLFYYKSKAIIIVVIAVASGFFLFYSIQTTYIGSDNILAKNERTEGGGSRAGLVTENLKIITDYPYGLIFHGQTWDDVSKRNSAFRGGLTSHNAYLMFVTYLGPFLGIGLLIFLYYRIAGIFKRVIVYSRLKENALLLSLCFAFLAVSLNALFHNAWLLNTNGPTVFLYFSILHLSKQMEVKGDSLLESDRSIQVN